MIRPQKEEIEKRYDLLPKNIKEVLLSDEWGDVVWQVCETNHLKEEQIKSVSMFLGYIILGFLHPEDFEKEVNNETGVDTRIVKAISEEITKEVLLPIALDLQTLYGFYIRGFPTQYGAPITQPQSAKQEEGQKEEPAQEALAPLASTLETERPQEKLVFNEPARQVKVEQTTPPTSPYVLHEEAPGIKSVSETIDSGELVRPYFYDPTQTTVPKTEKPVIARLEIGQEGWGPKKEIKNTKTTEPEARVVHYSGPLTPLDPFIGQQKERMVPPATEKLNNQLGQAQQIIDRKIHPDNIIDLKDLPK
jgi:hypothetical protein